MSEERDTYRINQQLVLQELHTCIEKHKSNASFLTIFEKPLHNYLSTSSH